jgi:hypothetical protein
MEAQVISESEFKFFRWLNFGGNKRNPNRNFGK